MSTTTYRVQAAAPRAFIFFPRYAFIEDRVRPLPLSLFLLQAESIWPLSSAHCLHFIFHLTLLILNCCYCNSDSHLHFKQPKPISRNSNKNSTNCAYRKSNVDKIKMSHWLKGFFNYILTERLLFLILM